MSRFDRYVLSQLMLLFAFFSLVLVGVYWINRAVILFDQLIADGQSAGTFLTFTALALPNVMRLVLPISAFAAAVYVTNRLTSESELVVAQAMGMSPFRLARPVLAFGILIALLMGLLVHVLVPQSRTQLADRQKEIEANITARMLIEGQFLHPAKGVTFYIREISPEGELRAVFLSDARDGENRTTYTAQRAYLVRDTDGPQLVMVDGTAQILRTSERQLTVTTFDNFAYDIGALIEGGDQRKRDVREYDTRTLFFPDEAALEATRKDPAVFLYEAHLRLAQPFAPLIAALIGFAALQLGSFSRFGVWRQIGLAIVLIMIIQVVENVTADLVRRDAALWPLVYLPSGLGLVMAVAMLAIAGRPAPAFIRRWRAQRLDRSIAGLRPETGRAGA